MSKEEKKGSDPFSVAFPLLLYRAASVLNEKLGVKLTLAPLILGALVQKSVVCPLFCAASGGMMGWASLQRCLALRGCAVYVSCLGGNEHTVVFVVVLRVSMPGDNGHAPEIQHCIQLAIDIGIVKPDYRI